MIIGSVRGEVVFSDGSEVVIETPSGIGYQVYYSGIFNEGTTVFLLTSHIIREASQELYGFNNLRDKKMFEMLISVKGVGPKSAYALVGTLGTSQIVDAVIFKSKKILTQVPGIGPKAAAQLLLDLEQKIQKIKMYDSKIDQSTDLSIDSSSLKIDSMVVLDEAIVACKELGFREENVISVAKKILENHHITKSEQLVHLVLKEI